MAGGGAWRGAVATQRLAHALIGQFWERKAWAKGKPALGTDRKHHLKHLLPAARGERHAWVGQVRVCISSRVQSEG